MNFYLCINQRSSFIYLAMSYCYVGLHALKCHLQINISHKPCWCIYKVQIKFELYKYSQEVKKNVLHPRIKLL